jgi:hypothetical protein
VRALPLLLTLTLAACAGGGVDPGDLDARDLLGIAPRVAARWDADERASARAVLIDSAAAGEPEAIEIDRAVTGSGDAWAIAALTTVDRQRGEPAILARGHQSTPIVVDVVTLDLPPPPQPSSALIAEGWEQAEREGWDHLLTGRGGALAAIAAELGHPTGAPLPVRPAPRAPFAAAYITDVDGASALLVNPVLLAALDSTGEPPLTRAAAVAAVPLLPAAPPSPPAHPERRAGAAGPESRGGLPAITGNPYSFFGSAAECASAEQLRCDACLPSATCDIESRDATDGNAECTQLAANAGEGYYLFCVNLALAIATVSDCTAGRVPACPQVTSAGNQLAALDANRNFLDDAACRDGLDACLAEIYGEPTGDYPLPGVDAGVDPPPPPRDITPGCGGNDSSCDFSPQCDLGCSGEGEGGNCDDSCDPACSGGASCGDCDSSSGGGSGGGSGCDVSCGEGGGGGESSQGCDTACGGGDNMDQGCGSCGSDEGGGDGDGDGCGSCGGDDGSSGGDGDGCGSCGGDSSGEGDGCSAGSCGGSGDSSSSGSGCGGSGGGSSSGCNVGGRSSRARMSIGITIGWALFPLLVLGVLRRRERRKPHARQEEVQP